jgi:lipoprotein-releasing system permease protein
MLPYFFARRYLFSKKSTNAINIIATISVVGMILGSTALIIVLSVFNGFEDLITSLYNSFNPDIKIQASVGKVFTPDSTKIAALRQIKGVTAVSETVEEIAFFEYNRRQDFGVLKGVDANFQKCNGIIPAITSGRYALQNNEQHLAVAGMGMEYKLGLNVEDPFSAIKVYMPKRANSDALMGAPFKVMPLVPAGTFAIQADFDAQYILSDIDFARQILSYYQGEVSYLEVGIDSTADIHTVQNEVKRVMGNDFIVKNRYEQDEAFYKIMNMERWIGFAIAAFTLLLVAFNMVGSLWMLVIEKRHDIAILKSMGATNQLVRNIFLAEGLLLSGLGMLVGFALSIAFILAQQYFGIIPLEGNMVVNSYPMSMRIGDFVLVALTVLSIGLVASYLPAYRASRIDAIVNE